jgi:hypothetical protein
MKHILKPCLTLVTIIFTITFLGCNYPYGVSSEQTNSLLLPTWLGKIIKLNAIGNLNAYCIVLIYLFLVI